MHRHRHHHAKGDFIDTPKLLVRLWKAGELAADSAMTLIAMMDGPDRGDFNEHALIAEAGCSRHVWRQVKHELRRVGSLATRAIRTDTGTVRTLGLKCRWPTEADWPRERIGACLSVPVDIWGEVVPTGGRPPAALRHPNRHDCGGLKCNNQKSARQRDSGGRFAKPEAGELVDDVVDVDTAEAPHTEPRPGTLEHRNVEAAPPALDAEPVVAPPAMVEPLDQVQQHLVDSADRHDAESRALSRVAEHVLGRGPLHRREGRQEAAPSGRGSPAGGRRSPEAPGRTTAAGSCPSRVPSTGAVASALARK